MRKIVKAIQPYIHSGHLNFKLPVFEAWKESAGLTASPRYPNKIFHALAYKYDFPDLKWLNFKQSEHEAYLMFVEPISLYFDSFPYYTTHEIIPMFWDCWPIFYDKVENWIKKHNIKTAIFTSHQEMEEIKRRIPNLSTIYCPEAINTKKIGEGGKLLNREIDILEFGRSNEKIINIHELEQIKIHSKKIRHIATQVNGKFLYDEKELYDIMQNAKITICLTRNITHPKIAGNVETLTQRYWEAMLSRIVIIGHAPKELIELIGYNPVIELSFDGRIPLDDQIISILKNINNYQHLVDKNRETALRMGDWNLRISLIKDNLKLLGYH